jgi:NADPH-dependent ferric siderophore reductase
MTKHVSRRVRYESRQRTLTVCSKQHVTPGMLRIVVGGEELGGFTSLSADDHIKLHIPGREGDTVSRDFTPRRFDPTTTQLTIDIAAHPVGAAIEWAREVEVGSTLTIAGPRGSLIVPDDFDWWLMVGDETAMPAIGRRVEELVNCNDVITVVAVEDEQEQQAFVTDVRHTAIWVHRPREAATSADALIKALRQLRLPAGDGYVWIAAEAGVARAVKQLVVHEMRHPVDRLRACGYWVDGKEDSYEKLDH